MANKEAFWCNKHKRVMTGFLTQFCPKCVEEEEMTPVIHPRKYKEESSWTYEGTINKFYGQHISKGQGFATYEATVNNALIIPVWVKFDNTKNPWPVGSKIKFNGRICSGNTAISSYMEIDDYEVEYP